mgnify:CR=1 FL=1
MKMLTEAMIVMPIAVAAALKASAPPEPSVTYIQHVGIRIIWRGDTTWRNRKARE